MVLKSFDLALLKKTNDEGVVHVKAVLALIMLQDSMKSEMHGNVHNDDGTFCSMKSVVQMNCATRRLNLFFQ